MSDEKPKVGRRDRLVYFAIAVGAAIVVFFTNDAINTYLEQLASTRVVAMLAALPVLVMLTRPLQVTPGHRTRRQERAMAVTYAIRSRRFSLLFRSFFLGVFWMIVAAVISLVLYQLALYRQMAAVANWFTVTWLAMLIWNFVPGRFHLQPSTPFTIAVAARDSETAALFAGLVALDRTQRHWLIATAESADAVVERVYGVLAGREKPAPLQTARIYFTLPRIWSRITGDRAIPVDLVDRPVAQIVPRRRFGIVLLITDDMIRDPIKLAKFAERELRTFGHAFPNVAVAINEIAGDTASVVTHALEDIGVGDVRIFKVTFDPQAAKSALHSTNAAEPVTWLLSRPPFHLRWRRKKK